METYAAVRLEINSWLWKGVPFYIRGGKCLPVTCTEVIVRFRWQPPVCEVSPPPNDLRFRISPDVCIGLGVRAKRPGERMDGGPVELQVCQHDDPNAIEAYERLLTEAMKGDATDFARENYMEEGCRVVDSVLGDAIPLREYEPGTWGPSEGGQGLAPPRGWQDPVLEPACGSHT